MSCIMHTSKYKQALKHNNLEKSKKNQSICSWENEHFGGSLYS